ncbi:hypothetical protein ECG_00727 [Echinococcus granulosus]|uniref:Expressed conserved protein n=1 Tax=Echinococcus granulosus TaxID=6210 RepID=A0A068WDB9_ECHGR|nr:hypothetical protein ECG_00727 [Echinococcus granulosus]CDS16411.1 expressed conserved protein [Echinococcus granulosus]
MFSFVDPRYDLGVEYADSGFCEEYPSDWEYYFDWIPPLNRRRRPAGDGTFCSSPNSPPLKEEYKDPLSIQSEPHLPRPSTSTPSSSVPISSTSRSVFSLPPSTPGAEPLGAYLLRRFLDGENNGTSALLLQPLSTPYLTPPSLTIIKNPRVV